MRSVQQVLLNVCLLLSLIACGNSGANDLAATIDAQNTRLALVEIEGQESEATPANTNANPSTVIPPVTADASTPFPEPTETITPVLEGSIENAPTLLWSANTKNYVITPDRVYLEEPKGTVTARDLRTGSLIWTAENAGTILTADSTFAYVAAAEQRIDVLHANSGEFSWRVFTPEPIEMAPGAQSNVLVESDDPELVILSLLLGSHSLSRYVFHIEVGTGEITQQTVLDPGGVVNDIFITPHADIGRSLRTGELLWQIPERSEWEICGPFIVFLDVRRTENNEVYALVAYEIETGRGVWATPISGDSDGRIECALGGWFGNLPSTFGYNQIFARSTYLRFFKSFISPESRSVYFSDRFPEPMLSFHLPTGELQTTGLPSTADVSRRVDTYEWLGETNSSLVYVHEGFGLTQAYDTMTHDLVWENAQLILDELIGGTSETLIGLVEVDVFSNAAIMVGLDPESGIEKWRYEYTADSTELRVIVGNYLFISPGEGSDIWILDPDTGEPVTAPSIPGKPRGVISLGDLLVIHTEFGLAVLTN